MLGVMYMPDVARCMAAVLSISINQCKRSHGFAFEFVPPKTKMQASATPVSAALASGASTFSAPSRTPNMWCGPTTQRRLKFKMLPKSDNTAYNVTCRCGPRTLHLLAQFGAALLAPTSRSKKKVLGRSVDEKEGRTPFHSSIFFSRTASECVLKY